ncbi:MAG TPA: phage holin family protein [bacterium]|nr:phage holin family protein [bacterium]
MGFLIRWLINAVALYLTTLIVPGVRVPSVAAAVLAALVLGIVNAVLRPIILLLTLPLNILTLGLFTFVVNAFMLWIVAVTTHQLVLASVGAALLGAIVLSVISFILSRLVADA